MGKVSRAITFDKDVLNKLVGDPNSCVRIQSQIYHLALHPFQLTDVHVSIKEILNNLIAKYDKEFDGILLGCHNIKLLENVGSISFDNSFLHLDMEADFYIFKPEVGKTLSGIVNKKSKDHVGCLVHNAFNVTLPRPDKSENWLGNSIQLGQEIRLEIIYTDFNGRLPYIRGNILSILSDDSGFSTSEEQTPSTSKQNNITKFNDSDSEAEIIIKKDTKHKSKREINESDSEKEKNYSDADCFVTKRKHKKSPHKSEINQDESDREESSKIHKKHKKKKKKHKEEHEYTQILEDVDEAINRSLTNESFNKKRKKHRKSAQESDSNMDISVNENYEHQKKTKKHKQMDDALESPIFEYTIEENAENYEDTVQASASNVKVSDSYAIPKKKKKHKHEDEISNIDMEPEENLHIKKKKKKHSTD